MLGLGIVLLVAACHDIGAPPRPAAVRVPQTVGQIVRVDPRPWTFLLDDGRLIEVGGTESSAEPMTRLTRELPSGPSSAGAGGLLLVGRDAAGPFYAATSGPRSDGCFELHGDGYLEPGRVHLSSGLALELAPDATVRNERDTHDPSWLLDFDRVCVGRDGRVVSVVQLPLGA